MAEFRQLALDLGIPEDSISTLINKGKPGLREGVSSGAGVRAFPLAEMQGCVSASCKILDASKVTFHEEQKPKSHPLFEDHLL